MEMPEVPNLSTPEKVVCSMSSKRTSPMQAATKRRITRRRFLTLAGALGLAALASSTKKQRPLTRAECADTWAEFLARRADSIEDPAKVRAFAAIFDAADMGDVRACLERRAGELEAGDSTTACYDFVRPVLAKNFAELSDPQAARNIAGQARRAGLPELEECFNELSESLA